MASESQWGAAQAHYHPRSADLALALAREMGGQAQVAVITDGSWGSFRRGYAFVILGDWTYHIDGCQHLNTLIARWRSHTGIEQVHLLTLDASQARSLRRRWRRGRDADCKRDRRWARNLISVNYRPPHTRPPHTRQTPAPPLAQPATIYPMPRPASPCDVAA